MLERMPAVVFDHWKAFDRISPIGAWRADVLVAMQIARTLDVYRDRDKQPAPLSYTDFVPDWDPQADDEEALEERRQRMIERIEQLNVVFGGQDKRGEKDKGEVSNG